MEFNGNQGQQSGPSGSNSGRVEPMPDAWSQNRASSALTVEDLRNFMSTERTPEERERLQRRLVEEIENRRGSTQVQRLFQDLSLDRRRDEEDRNNAAQLLLNFRRNFVNSAVPSSPERSSSNESAASYGASSSGYSFSHGMMDAAMGGAPMIGVAGPSGLQFAGSSPGGRRAPKRMTPNAQKDAYYYARRIKNNLAAKKSRESRRKKEEQNHRNVEKYTIENATMRAQAKYFAEELRYLMNSLEEKKSDGNKGSEEPMDTEEIEKIKKRMEE